ncbi:MAG: hypothetical protein IJA82_03935 [Clostridia bacterium]|nr:hypothetical protein [Clostridia bacterium]
MMIDLKKRFNDAINRANNVYKNSLNPEELKNAHASLTPIIKLKNSDDDYNELITNANALSLRIGAKRIAFDATRNNLDYDLDWAQKKLSELEASASAGGFSKTYALILRVQKLISSLKEIYSQSKFIRASYQNDRGANSESVVAQAKAQYGELYKECDKLPTEAEIFTGVAFLDIKAETREFIDSLIQEAEDNHKRLTSNRVSERINGIVNALPDEWKSGYHFCPGITSGSNKMMVVLTPFREEFSFLAYSYARDNAGRVAIIDVSSKVFGGCVESDINAIFDYLATTADVLAITGLAMYYDNNKPAILRALYRVACSKKGIGVFIHDFNSRLTVWKEIEDALPKAYDIYYMYLKLPGFRETVDAIRDASVRQENVDEIFIKKHCAYLGYVGVNDIIKRVKDDYTWDFKDFAEIRSIENYGKVINYIMDLKSDSQLVDPSWGISYDKAIDESFEPRKSFGGYDYDTKRRLNPQNIKLITEAENFSLPAKCGLVTNYCLLCGDDKSTWYELDDEEQFYRLSVATKTVGRLLNTEYDPEIEIKTSEDGKNGGAYCSGAGKLIVYYDGALKNYDELLKTVCHEMFHSFQYTAMHFGWKRWHESELLVCKARVDEWSECEPKYISSKENERAYRIQGLEVDARVFATQAATNLSTNWSKINLL